MAPMTPEKKAAMMERLKAGKAKIAAARKEAMEKGLPDPHPRKKRAKKSDGAIQDPLAAPSANDTVRGIDQATKDGVASKPVDPTPVATKPIDVPGLPGDAEKKADKKDIVQDAEKKKVIRRKKGLSSTGKTEKVNETEEITNEETGHQVISAMFPGQAESIKKALKANKKTVTTAAGMQQEEHPNDIAESKTVRNVRKHIPDVKSVEAVGKPFSFSAIRKVLYQ